MTITRGYKKDEADKLLEINNLCYAGGECPPPEKFKWMLGISDVWVARENNLDPIGFAIVNPEYGVYLWSIAVLPKFQRRNVGGNLLQAVITAYAQKKEKDIRLHVSANNPAQKLYFDYGFRVYDLAYKYYDEPCTLGLMMKREL